MHHSFYDAVQQTISLLLPSAISPQLRNTDIGVFIQSSGGPHGAHLGPTGTWWAPCWPHEPCYLGMHVFKVISVPSINHLSVLLLIYLF